MTFQHPGGLQGEQRQTQPLGASSWTGMQTATLPQVDAATRASFLTQSFFWMFAGLLLTAGIAAFAQFNEAFVSFGANNFVLLIVAQLALALGIQFGIRRISASVALGLFFVYAASIGVSIGVIVALLYPLESVAAAFFSAAAMFGGAALYGYTTKRSLATIGGYAYMAAFGLFVALIVNFFIGSGPIGYVISFIGVIIFTVLTAWDVQRISSGQLVAALGSVEKAAVIGALHLYLDFVNLFLFLLRLFGGRR